MDVEDGPLRVPYIEGEIWGSSPHTKLKEGMSNKINFAQFPREPSIPNPRRFIKAALNTHSVYQNDPRYSQKESIDDNAPRTPKRQKHAMGRRRNPGTHRETRLNRPRCRPENVKILLPVRGAEQHDFEGLLWGQKVLEALAHSISSPRPTPRRKKCPRTNERNPDCQNVLPRTTLSSAGQNHKRGRCHVARGNPLKDPKRDSKPYGLAIGAW